MLSLYPSSDAKWRLIEASRLLEVPKLQGGSSGNRSQAWPALASQVLFPPALIRAFSRLHVTMVPPHLHASPLPAGSTPHCHSAGHSAPGMKGEGTSCDLPSLSLLACPPPWPVHTSLYQHSLRTPCQAILQARQPALGVFFPRKTSRAGTKGGTFLFLTHHFPCLLFPSWGQSRCIVSGRGALDPSPSSTYGVPQTLIRGFVQLASASQLHPFWVGFDPPLHLSQRNPA